MAWGELWLRNGGQLYLHRAQQGPLAISGPRSSSKNKGRAGARAKTSPKRSLVTFTFTFTPSQHQLAVCPVRKVYHKQSTWQ